jgi:hypothetical protein
MGPRPDSSRIPLHPDGPASYSFNLWFAGLPGPLINR